MKKRRTIWIAFAEVSTVCMLAVFLWQAGRSKTMITPENGAKIISESRIDGEVTQAHAEEILGGPARDESTGPLENYGPEVDGKPDQARANVHYLKRLVMGPERQIWISDSAIIILEIREGGKVAPVACAPVRRVNSGPLDWIIRFFRNSSL